MPQSYQEGMSVNTKYGPGTIEEVRGNNSFVVSLNKNNGLRIRLSRNEIYNADPKSAIVPARESATAIDRRNLKIQASPSTGSNLNFRAIEALRFGLVPQAKIAELTSGYDKLKSWIIERLPHTNGNNTTVSEVCGPYGTGKSHFMSVVRQIARLDGYVTARVEIDGNNISLGNPETLLESLWCTIKANGLESSTPLLELYLQAIRKGKLAPKIAPRGTDRIASNYNVIRNLDRLGRLEAFEYMIDAILSSSKEFTVTEVRREISRSLYEPSLKVERMVSNKVSDRPYDFVESLFGHSKICEMAGFKGLVVTIDEFEVQHFDKRWDRVSKLIEVMTRYLAGELDHLPMPCAVLFATVAESGHRGDAVVDEMIDKCDGARLELQELKIDDLIEISKSIYQLYKEAYGIEKSFDKSMADSAFLSVQNTGGIVRGFIKHYVALLDMKYGPSQQ